MFNLPEHILTQIKEKMKSPEGTVTFNYKSSNLFDPTIQGGIILKVITGSHIFLLERDCDLNVNFYHSSPGTGTRLASINLKKLRENDIIFFALIWSTKEIKLSMGTYSDGDELHIAYGKESKKILRSIDDNVIQLGDEEVDIMETRVFSNGSNILEPTAIEAWNNTIEAIKILQSGTSENTYIYEVVQSNITISTLVTGFEVYSKKRCIELDKGGISPDLEALINRVFSNYEKKKNEPEALRIKSELKGKTLYEEVIQTKINFQSYDECKKAYSKAYNIKFGEIGIDSNRLNDLQKIIKFRHRIIHVSPLLTIVNESELPSNEPMFSNKNFADNAINLFDDFINALHEATLKLKRLD